MGFNLKGYVLEHPRVGSANSPFTITPDVFVSDSGAYNAAYPSTETNPRTDYMVVVTGDGKLPDATFGYSKNEGLTPTGPGVQRFDYDGRKQSFVPLAGSAPDTVGFVTSTGNTTRLKVVVPIGVLSSAPFRLSVGDTGSGHTLVVSLVSSFGAPSAGTVELLTLGSNAGQLNWNPADLVTYDGEVVRFQRQSFYTTKESNGKLGFIENDTLMLSPIPGPGQTPLIRIGYGLWLIAVEKATEGAFSVNPSAGHVEWARTTGLLKFNASDITANSGRNVYYDGTLLATGRSLPRQSLGTINAAGVTTPQSVTITSVPTPGGDLIFRVPGVVQFAEAVLVTTLDPNGKQGQVQYTSSGQVQVSLADRITYGTLPLEVVFGDLPLEHGLSMRFFRTPVDLAGTDTSLKDVSAFYTVTGATWSSPIIATPQVFLPSIPVDDASLPITIKVAQGTGSFTGSLPRLDVLSPPAGPGYVIDFDQNILQYAERHNDLLVPLQQSTQIGVLPNPLLVDSQVSFALETAPSSGFYTTLVRDTDYLLDAVPGHVIFTTSAGTKSASGSAGTFSGTTFTDTTKDFIAAGVVSGNYLIVGSGSSKGVYTITAAANTNVTTDLPGVTEGNLEYEIRSGKEVLADRFFQPVLIVDPNTKVERIRSLGTITNSPRLSVNVHRVLATRFTFADGTPAVASVVANDGAFTAPGTLTPGTIEISQATGDLNFSSVDITANRVVNWVFALVQNQDYRLQPILGTIDFTERMLTGEQVLLTYTSGSDTSTTIVERATFLVRKEQVPHPTPTSTVTFNPSGHLVAATPAPRVFRGGRPQVTDQQVTVDVTLSSVTFLADGQLTDALPHGSTLNPIERVMVDYYVYDALGGEKNTSALQPPINLARVFITQGASSFPVTGDWTAKFPAGNMLRVGSDQVYLLGTATYDGGTNLTTVPLALGQTFQDDFTDPALFVSSGPVRIAPSLGQPSYFTTEMTSYDPVPRGMNILRIAGDRTLSYKSGTILLFTDGTYTDTYRVSGVSYNTDSNRTEISLTSNTRRQYGSPLDLSPPTLKFSVRPIFENAPTTAPTQLNPVLTFPGDPTTQQYSVFRRVEGQLGVLLSSPTDYTIEASGIVTISTPLRPLEELSIFYTGLRTVQAGLRLKSSYTNIISPNAENGLLGQVLMADFSIRSLDNFYFRVETMTNFRGETATDIENQAKSNAPSGGPQTSNMATPQLNQQGRESAYFQEGHLGNQDIIARSVLKFYNDAVNDLEDALHAIDGRVVGDHHGRFLFDGLNDNPIRTSPSTVTNQIDDRLQVSPFPLPDGTAQTVYLTGPFSRFFCTRRNLFTSSPALSGSDDNDPIAAFSFKNLTSLPSNAFKRWPRAQILHSYPAGTTTFEVDNALGTNDALQRPAFITQMRVVIQDAAGTFYIDDAAHVTVSSIGAGPPQTLTLSGGPSLAVPAGATIYLAPSDANTSLSAGDYPPVAGANGAYEMFYEFGKSLNANLSTGELLYVKRKFPFDGTLPTTFIPKFFLIFPVQTEDILQCNGVGLSSTNTAPYKFPALYGGVTDDDGDQAVPFVGPTFDGELTSSGGGPLNDELVAEVPSTGTIRTATTVPYVGTGDLDVTTTIITDTTPYSSPIPKVYDLVRILTGLNGATEFRRIVAVGPDNVTVDSPFTTQDTGFTYTIAVSASTVAGAATFAGTTLTDLAATFTSDGTTVGQSVVLTSGLDTALRRQVTAIVSDTVLTLNAAFPTAAAENYRVDNPLDTFGGAGSAQQTVSNALATEIATISTKEQTAILTFFSDVFTSLLTSTTGVVSLGFLTTFTDSSADYIAAGISAADFVYVSTGASRGVYPIASVNSATQLTVGTSFPGAASGISYQIVSAFGAGLTTFQDMMGILQANDTFLTSTQTFQTLVDTSVPVLLAGVSDPTAFARGLLSADLDARATTVQSRVTYLTDPAAGPVAKIEKALSGSERLYDKRYVWIDTRINLEKGLLVRQTRATADRIKSQADTLNQLIKLLAVSP